MNLRFLIILAICFFNLSIAFAQKTVSGRKGYEIKVKIDNYTEDTLLLANRFGSKTYIRDTAVGKDSKGYFVFKRDTLLDGGVYLMLIKPNNNYFEFLISNDESQKLQLHTKLEGNDMVKHLKIDGCNDNKVFVEYLHYLGHKNKESEFANKRALELDSMLKSPLATESDKENWTKERTKHIDFLQGLSKEVEKYQKDMIVRNPSYLSSKLILSSQPPVIPKEIEAQGQPHTYYYFKNRYWDNFDWADKRMLRTPLFEQKIEYYLDKLTVQMPDSCILGCDFILGNVLKGGNKDMYQFAAAHLLNKYAASKLICMDKVYVYLGDRYYCGAMKPSWVDSAQLEKICENVNDLRYALCGQQAPEIELTNIANNQKIKLSNINARFTAVYFWDPACGNCTKNSQKFVPVYEKWKNKGLEVYGICSKSIDEVEECKKKIDEVGMKWINTTDKSYPLAYIKKYYDVKMNPFLYLLDKNKKILYKRIDPEQLDDILTREIELEDKAAKGQK